MMLVQGATWSYFGTDGIGSTRFMLNSARTMTYAANYDPYGQVMAQYLPDATPSFGFTGQMTDASGLQYLRARYYDPSLGTFLSQDPVRGVPGGASIRWNPYIYAGGNPTTYVDPNGEWFWIALLVGVPAIAGVTAAAYDANVTQGFGLGGHNQGNINAINWHQVALAGGSGFLGGVEASAAIVLSPAYLTLGAMGISPEEANYNFLNHFGLGDEYAILRRSPYHIAGKGGGDVGLTVASLVEFGRAINNLTFSPINMRPPTLPGLAGAGQLAYASGQISVSVPSVAGAGRLIGAGGATLSGAISFFSSRRGGGNRYIYESNPKHGSKVRNTSRGSVGVEPKNGQRALNNSVQVKSTSSRRVGVDPVSNEFVILDETHPGRGVFHGHVRKWSDLTRQMQNALTRAGLATKKGKIVR